MHFKTIEDYFNAATSHGFEIVDFTEARVSAEDMNSNISFFSNVNGHPLHIVMKIRKPMATNNGAALSSINTLDLLPKKLNWPRTVTNNVENSLVMWLPPAANDELVDAALQVHEKGISVDDLVIGKDIDLPHKSRLARENVLLAATKHFADAVRSRLLHETGAVIVKGLDMNALGGVEQLDKMTHCSKIAYFILSEHIGTVDVAARGKLFDVKRCVLRANELHLYSLAPHLVSAYLTIFLSCHFPFFSVPTSMPCLNRMIMSSFQCQILKLDGTLMVPRRIGFMMLCLSCAFLLLQREESFEFPTLVSRPCFLSHTIALFSHLF